MCVAAVCCAGAIRDGGIDPANLGKGDWIYSMVDATNKLGGHISSVTNETSLMQFYKSQGIRYIIVKAATSDQLFNGCYSFPQFTSNLCRIAHTNGILIFGYNRSYGANVAGEIAISDYVFQQGADGFVWDAEAEWESVTANTWITNGPAQAWALCSAVRSNWPTKFLAHAPFPIISLHSSFPYKEFGYWSDAVMPQIYHFGSSGIRRSSSAAINWTDVNWRKWQNDTAALPPTNINGLTVYWTNAIKPLVPVHDVYGTTPSLACEGTASAYADKDVLEFMDYLAADPHCVTPGGYNGVNFWRADLHGPKQWSYIQAATLGSFPGVVNNVVLDDNAANVSGGWAAVRTFAATTTASTYYGATGSDTNSFGTNYWVKPAGNGSAFVEFQPEIAVPGDYNVYQWHPYRADAATNVPFVITHAAGTTTVLVNQQTNDGLWSFVGRFPFDPGTNAIVRITDGITDTNDVVMADGLKLVFVPPTNAPTTPTGLVAVAIGATQVRLTWSDVATNETGGVISRSPAFSGPYVEIGTVGRGVTNFTVTGLAPATTYYFAVRATNYAGSSLNSNRASATTWTNSTRFKWITLDPDGRLTLSGTGQVTSIAVEASTNLVEWTVFTNTANSNGTFSFRTEPITNAPQRFFRLKSP